MQSVLLLILSVNSCFTSKDIPFGKLNWGKMMKNRDFVSLYYLTIEECYNECNSHKLCRSFNYFEGAEWCWLNNVSRSESPENIQKEVGFIFSDKEDWNQVNSNSTDKGGEVSATVKECEDPPIIGESLILGNQKYFGSKRKYMCYSRGKLIATSLVTCLRNGSWTRDYQFTCPAPCPEKYMWFKKLSFCYLIGDTCETWRKSRDICQSQGGHLLTIPNEDGLQFLKDMHAVLFAGICQKAVWLGATDKVQEGKWIWVTGKEMTYSLWEPGQPDNSGNEDCVEMVHLQRYRMYTFNDLDCNEKRKYVCQKFP